MVSHPWNQGALHIELVPSTIWQKAAEVKSGITLRIAVQKADLGLFDLALQMEVS
jgi:hypothetical protein